MSLAKNSSMLIVAQAAAFISAIFLSVVISRVLGPSLRGTYFLLKAGAILSINFGSLGLDCTNTVMLAKKKVSLAVINANSLAWSILISVPLLGGYLLFQSLLHRTALKGVPEVYCWVAIIIVPFSMYMRFWGSMMIGLNRIKTTAIYNTASNVIGVIGALLVLLAFNLGLKGLVGLWAVTTLAGFIIQFSLAVKYGGFRLKPDYNVFRKMLSFGAKAHIGTIASRIYNRLDLFFVNIFVNTAGVGFYSLAESLGEKMFLMTDPVVTASTPRITGDSEKKATILTARILRHFIMLGSLFTVAWYFAGPILIPLVYGQEYLPALMPLKILLPGLIMFGAANNLAVFYTNQLQKPLTSSLIGLLGLVINIPLVILLAGRFETAGAAAAVALTYFATAALFMRLFKRRSGLGWHELVLVNAEDIKDYYRLLRRLIVRARLTFHSGPKRVPQPGS